MNKALQAETHVEEAKTATVRAYFDLPPQQFGDIVTAEDVEVIWFEQHEEGWRAITVFPHAPDIHFSVYHSDLRDTTTVYVYKKFHTSVIQTKENN